MRAEGFTKTFVVLSEVSNGIDSVKDIRTELIYDSVGQAPTRGVFYGDEQTFSKLGKILWTGEVSFHGSWSSLSASFNMSFRATGIQFGSYRGRYETDKLCEFTCNELEVETNFQLTDNRSSKVNMLLIQYAVPKRRELLLPRFSTDQNENLPGYKDWLEYQTTLGTLKIRRETYSSAMTVESKQGSFSFDESVFSFEVPVDGKDVDEVIRESESLIEDYLKLISFIIQCDTKYYKRLVCYLNPEGIELKNTLKLLKRFQPTQIRRPIAFGFHVVDELLRELMPKFASHPDKKGIEESILFFLAGVQAEILEVRLILMQSALETAVNTVRSTMDLPTEMCITCKKHLMTLKDLILYVISPLNVQVDDVYPSVKSDCEKTFPFIKYRNSLVHGRRNEIDYEDLSPELYRQQLVFERLIFHWIGFDAKKVEYLKMWEGVKPY